MNMLRYKPLSLINELLHNENFLNKPLIWPELTSQMQTDVMKGAWLPEADIKDTKDEVVITLDVPGVLLKDIEILYNAETGILSLKGHKSSKAKIEEENYTRIERSCGSFYREFRISESINQANIKATLNNGVLEISVPKKHGGESHKIAIKEES